jgi:hypothetical protein
VGQDVLGRALPQDDLVDPRPLPPVVQVEATIAVGPVEVDRELDGCERLIRCQAGERVGGP